MKTAKTISIIELLSEFLTEHKKTLIEAFINNTQGSEEKVKLGSLRPDYVLIRCFAV